MTDDQDVRMPPGGKTLALPTRLGSLQLGQVLGGLHEGRFAAGLHGLVHHHDPGVRGAPSMMNSMLAR